MQKSKLETKDHAEIVAEMEDIFSFCHPNQRMDYQMTRVIDGHMSGDSFDMFTIEKSEIVIERYASCELYPKRLNEMTSVMGKYGFEILASQQLHSYGMMK